MTSKALQKIYTHTGSYFSTQFMGYVVSVEPLKMILGVIALLDNNGFV